MKPRRSLVPVAEPLEGRTLLNAGVSVSGNKFNSSYYEKAAGDPYEAQVEGSGEHTSATAMYSASSSARASSIAALLKASAASSGSAADFHYSESADSRATADLQDCLQVVASPNQSGPLPVHLVFQLVSEPTFNYSPVMDPLFPGVPTVGAGVSARAFEIPIYSPNPVPSPGASADYNKTISSISNDGFIPSVQNLEIDLALYPAGGNILASEFNLTLDVNSRATSGSVSLDSTLSLIAVRTADGRDLQANAYTFMSCDLDSHPEVAIDINDTTDQSDDITLYNSADQKQTVPVKITNKGNTTETFELRVSPPGAATLSQGFMTLDAGKSTGDTGEPPDVIVTPQAESSAPNDVQITAVLGSVIFGTEDMTIVRVEIPNQIRNFKTTPLGMLADRIPPRIGTDIHVKVSPGLAGSGQHVTIAVVNQNDDNGTVNLNGSYQVNGESHVDLTSEQDVKFQGVTQTAPTPDGNGGHAGKLKAVVRVHGKDAVMTDGFSVAAVPVLLSESYSGIFSKTTKFMGRKVTLKGIKINISWGSDSSTNPLEVREDLSEVVVSEVLQTQQQVGTLSRVVFGSSGYKRVWDSEEDDHAVGQDVITASGGYLLQSQTHMFTDSRTGTHNFPVPKSGYIIEFTVDGIRKKRKGRKDWMLTISKKGMLTSAYEPTKTLISSGAGTTDPKGGIMVSGIRPIPMRKDKGKMP